MKTAIKVLILTLALLIGGNQWVTAEHNKFVFDLPHSVASKLLPLDLEVVGPGTTYEVAGCDLVWTMPLRSSDNTVAGFAIHAEKGKKARLVTVQLWEMKTKEKYFSYLNVDDYNALKKCHSDGKDQLGV